MARVICSDHIVRCGRGRLLNLRRSHPLALLSCDRRDGLAAVALRLPHCQEASRACRCSFLVLLGARVKNLLREKVKGLLPMLEVVGMFIDVPDVRNVVLLQIRVQGLADAD